jgi:hypothetical protein
MRADPELRRGQCPSIRAGWPGSEKRVAVIIGCKQTGCKQTLTEAALLKMLKRGREAAPNDWTNHDVLLWLKEILREEKLGEMSDLEKNEILQKFVEKASLNGIDGRALRQLPNDVEYASLVKTDSTRIRFTEQVNLLFKDPVSPKHSRKIETAG